jgi:ketosteroid isomerase-like protein
MSDKNVEIFRRVIEAFNAEGLDGAMRYFDEGIEVYDPDLPGDGTLRGHEAVRRTIGQMVDAFDQMTVRDFEFVPVGDRVVGLIHTAGRGEGRRGEMEVQIRDAHTMTFRNGKVVYWRLYLDAAEALSDVGLDAASEPDRATR